jgi:dTDP-4-amino-4,6-dideoxygalactose transaminase
MMKTPSSQDESPGQPRFAEPLHVGRPNIGDPERLLKRIAGVIERRWLSNNGPLVQEFEAQLKALLGVKHCIPVCNGTVALELAIRALDLDGEVILPSYTFVATAHALHWHGIRPVFADIGPRTHNLDPGAVERAITARTSGILAVHLWGRPAAVAELQALADRYQLQLLFDAAHAFGNTCQGRPVGNFGRCEVFSFHATKVVNCGEGGAITTNDDELAARLRLLQNFGFAGYDNVVCAGTNGKMSEINAALGLTNLESQKVFLQANQRNYELYKSGLAAVPGLTVISYDEQEQCNRQYIVVEVGPSFGCGRDDLVRALHERNVLARRYFWPGCHRMEPYRTVDPAAGRRLPNTEAVADRVLVLPTGQAVSAEDVVRICDIIKSVWLNGRKPDGSTGTEVWP